MMVTAYLNNVNMIGVKNYLTSSLKLHFQPFGWIVLTFTSKPTRRKRLFKKPTAHAYADDSQLYWSFSPAVSINQADAISPIETCIRDIRQWMLEDKSMLNDNKTEVLLIGTPKQLAKDLN